MSERGVYGAERVAGDILGPAIMALLLLDTVLTLLFEVLYLPLYAGTVVLPITALLAGPINIALMYGMSTVTTRTGWLVAPVAVWALGYLLLAGVSPGGDRLLSQDGVSVLLLAGGLLPPLGYLYYRMNSALFGSSASPAAAGAK